MFRFFYSQPDLNPKMAFEELAETPPTCYSLHDLEKVVFKISGLSPLFITLYFRAANRELSHLLSTTNSHVPSPNCSSMTNCIFSYTSVSRQYRKSASHQTLTSPL
ncbi:hypothetical protein TNCT_138901 [Trichonephila clavata]|uniref:Uncharacterized protein n=1 Tax=Trichonephila clavata TaxID=2740835 RepID=A0A8X6KAD2_TRICU|nr:hypothetical protein TNCT_138901 [Trichonephila clavata]